MAYGYTGNSKAGYQGSGAAVSAGLANRPKARLRYSGEFLTDAGWNITESSLAGLDSLDSDLSNQIAAGGLTPDMEREFDVAGGRVADLVARSRRGWGADLLQATRRSGGTLDPNTALAYQIEREGELDEASMDATKDIAFQRAAARMERTDRLYNTILEMRARKGAIGQQTISSGLGARSAALDPRKHNGQNTAAVTSMIGQIIGGFLGG